MLLTKCEFRHAKLRTRQAGNFAETLGEPREKSNFAKLNSANAQVCEFPRKQA